MKTSLEEWYSLCMTPVLDIPNFSTMSAEEIAAWALSDPEPIPLSTFCLNFDDGRQGLLREFYMIGETALFEAVSHVWWSLEEPRAPRCTAMGLAAGVGGTGKRGLRKALQKFLEEALSINNPIPAREQYGSLEEWHGAAMETYAADEADLLKLLEQYSKVLNGGSSSPT